MAYSAKRKGRKVDKTGRSRGESRFIKLDHWLFDSPAYRSLSTTARCLYHELLRPTFGSARARQVRLFTSWRAVASSALIVEALSTSKQALGAGKQAPGF